MIGRTIYYFLSHIGVSVYFLLVSIQIFLVPADGLSMKAQASSVLIRPGYGVADLRLVDPIPPERPAREKWLKRWENRNIHIDLDQTNTRIDRIRIKSPQFFIDGNRIAVYGSNISEVEKFYGQGTESGGSKRSYPLFGVDFLYDPVSKKVIEIIIFRPDRKELKLSPKAIQTIMKQMKLKK